MSRGPAVDDTVAPVLGRETHGPVIGGDGSGKSSVLNVPTLLMRTLIDRARESNLPLVLPEEIEGLLNPTGVHLIGQAREVTEPGVYDGVARMVHWIRAHVMLALADDPDPYVAWLDFDGDLYGKVFEAAQRQEAADRFHVGYGERGKPIVPEKPKWVGSRAFGPVFERAVMLAQHHPIEFGQAKLPVMQVMATTEATLLADAHVLCVDPAQVEVLPEWESPQEVFDFAADATLPFEPLFLDFTGPGGFAPAVNFTTNNPLRLRGALIWKQTMVEHGEVLIVAPYAWPEKLPGSFTGEVTEWQSSGWFMFNTVPTRPETGEVVKVGAVRLFLGQTQLYGEPATCWADAAAEESERGERGPLPGYAALPFSADAVAEATEDDVDLVAETIMLWGMMAWRSARVALAALSILEAVEVEFVDAPMEKRDRKRAVKRGWPIAQTVVIRSHSKRYRESSSAGEEAHYSHRFWRRATVAHYPLGTRVADARPDLVTPCKRPMGSNCGYCRKVKRPATIVGPKDKPLVLKTLMRRKDAA